MHNLIEESIWPKLAQESLNALGGLGLPSLGGKYILRLLPKQGPQRPLLLSACKLLLVFPSHPTLGAFLAGASLVETNFRTQIEADIRPFRGLLLGLFFVTTGTSIDMKVVAKIRKSAAFVAHWLLTAVGTSSLTQQMGFSDKLGALLAETNFWTQIEADIRPFRGFFSVIADTRNSEAFVALCLLTVAGTSLLTQQLGFSDTV